MKDFLAKFILNQFYAIPMKLIYMLNCFILIFEFYCYFLDYAMHFNTSVDQILKMCNSPIWMACSMDIVVCDPNMFDQK